MISQPDTHKTRPIGIFDSGVGGLTVMRAISEILPHEDLIYLGDTARVPYGNRAAETVRRYALNAADLLAERGVKAIVIACNTATSYALDALRTAHTMPVLGVIEPAARLAVKTTRTGHIAIIGTRGTIKSNCYPQTITRLNPNATVHQAACPLFVPLAEEGWLDGEVPAEVARRYMHPFLNTSVDTMILGCTHYPLLRPTIARALTDLGAPPIELLDSGQSTAHLLKKRLNDAGLLRPTQAHANPPSPHPSSRPGNLHFLLTDLPDEFEQMAMRFFGQHIASFEHVDIKVG